MGSRTKYTEYALSYCKNSTVDKHDRSKVLWANHRD